MVASDIKHQLNNITRLNYLNIEVTFSVGMASTNVNTFFHVFLG
jgi:hypothetical protein